MGGSEQHAARARWDRLALFCHVWALATLSDGVRWVVQDVWWGWPISGTALLAVLQPRRLWTFVVAMLVATLFVLVGEKPRWTPNHTFFIALGNLVIFGALLRAGLARRGAASATAARDRALELFAPPLIWMLLVFYAFVVLHKLNTDFFDPEVSCAATMYGRLAGRYFFLPPPSPALGTLAIWATLISEALIPLLLVLRPTRLLGVTLGFGFHFVLAQHPHGQLCSFSSMLYAVYFLCLPRPLADEMVRRVEALHERLEARLSPAGLRAALGAMVLLGVAGAALAYRLRGAGGVYTFSNLGWNFWALGVLALGLLSVWRVGASHAGRLLPPAPRMAIGWAMIAVVVFTGLNPYLGLRTETCWSMFSNLRTEVRPNHLFIPDSLRLTALQRDLVEIVESDDPYLAELGAARRLLPVFEVRRRLSRETDTTLRYRRPGGEQRTLVIRDGQSSDPELSEPVPWLAGAWLDFRPVYEAGKSRCSH